jgi:hypothetical protein
MYNLAIPAFAFFLLPTGMCGEAKRPRRLYGVLGRFCRNAQNA